MTTASTTFSSTRPRLLTHDGKTMSMKAWALTVGLGYTTLSERLRSGMSVAEALTRPFGQRARVLELNGRTQTIREWANETGIPHVTIANRLGLGWTTEEALTTPIAAARSARVKADRARERRRGITRYKAPVPPRTLTTTGGVK